MEGTFYYLRAEDRVPRDAVHIVIGGAVTVVAPGAFLGYDDLVRVELREGVREIGRGAFWDCPHLESVDCPSSLRAIDDAAFRDCERLSGPILREGLRRIGSHAFSGCDLRRIAVPSSVATIGDAAFAGSVRRCGRLSLVILREGLKEIGGRAFENRPDLPRVDCPASLVAIGEGAFSECKSLSVLTLREGLRRIGARAFWMCSLERITVPSSVVEIGEEAFAYCKNLYEVNLRGGMVMVAGGAFFRCLSLDRITIGRGGPSIVIQAGEDGNGRAAMVAGRIKLGSIHDRQEPARLILNARFLEILRRKDRRKLIDAINEITDGLTRGAGQLDLEDKAVANRIRACFANWLFEHKAGVAAVWELALWKSSLNRRREASRGQAAGAGRRAGVDALTRDDCRRTCGADVVIGPVLSYLWGPHRRAVQRESARLKGGG